MGRTRRPVVYFCLSFLLRMLLIVASTVSAVTMATSKDTQYWFDYDLDTGHNRSGTISFKFTDSPSFIYFVAALSVAGVYGIITKLSTCLVICLAPSSSIMLVLFAVFDVLILGVVASATGTAGSVAYGIFKGDLCSTYSRFCRHIGIALGFALFASVFLVILLWTSLISLYKRIPKQTFETSQPLPQSPLQTPPQAPISETSPHAQELRN
ncbi:CASP-like protein 1D1 [Argentina anserina]|uniref:CASP-like protein 1D1 n=1 Tax=Argentina anserina TaxID=57926 RepID=UPI00217649DC|nr:CASP-like protein 1D1 [Potentilla anserina]